MAVRINLTKKGKIAILAILFLMFAGTGGYLLWRVNQEDTVSPTDSDAGGTNTGCPAAVLTDCQVDCDAKSSPGLFYCHQIGTSNYGYIDGSSSGACGNLVCGGAKRCQCSDGWQIFTSSDSVDQTCTQLCGDSETPVVTQCSRAGGYGNSCGTNCQFPTSTSCQAQADAACKPYVAMCNQDGTISCEEYNDSQKCYGKLEECGNPLFEPNCVTNTCDSGTWNTQPSGIYEYCASIPYSFTATDSDGIDTSSISVKLNSTDRTTYSTSTSGTSTTISETLGGTGNCLAAGTYTLSTDWADSEGATGDTCALSTTFTVQPEVLNPDWEISKTGSEACIDDGTENPSSQIQYTIAVKNIGEGEGSIDKIVDTLDTKVLGTYISSISNDGAYANGAITWELEDTDEVFTADQEKTYTYTVTIPKDAFGIYANTVTAYPTEGENFVAEASVEADCVIEAPQTGIFDSTLSKIVLGTVLIIFGISFNQISSTTKKIYISVNDSIEDRRLKNFEKKVVKK